MNHIACISVPLWQGAEKYGMNLAPGTLYNIGLQGVLESQFEVTQHSMPELGTFDAENKYAVLADYLTLLKKQVLQAYKKGHFPLTIGGDHSLGLGSAAATAETFKNTGLIWFDAHGDMNTEATSDTGHIHGMPVAALMGLCSSELNTVPEVYIKPENIFWIGSRSIDTGEQRLIDEKHLHIYSAKLVQTKGMAWVMQNIIHQMHEQGIAHIHLSIDVDAIDPKLFPATSVPEPNGLTFEDFNIFVQSLRQIQHQIAAIDWVEYNPTLDNEQHECGKWCVGAIDKLLKTVLE